ncbi:uncharacterized protein [Chaetodon trifascialis]|uniref:uncharacterized protein n=1 Tax=Chaetodon trifascialis TaxID=109706 RepID=UPI0039952B22
MLLLSVKMYLALLWGASVLFSMESMSASIPATSSINSTADPDKTTEQLITAHVAHSATETQPVVWYSTHKSAEVSVSAAETTVLPTVETEEGTVTYSSEGSNDSKHASVATNTAAATASSLGPRLLRTGSAVTAAAGEATSSNSATIAATATPSEDQFHHHSPTTSTDLTSSNERTSAASLATVSSSQRTSTTQPEVTSSLSSTASPARLTQTSAFPRNLSSPSASPAPTVTANSTSETAPVFDSTASPVTTSETSAASTQRSSTSQHASVTGTHISTSEFTDPGGSSSTARPPTISSSTESVNTSTTSTSAAGIFIPHVPKKLPIPTATSTPATAAAPREASESPPSTKVQACSTRGVIKTCLIAIASLAALATIFIVSTIILCTKLSARKYKVKPQPATEMMCISALLPERTYTYTRQRNRVTNGVLVMHGGGDSDEDGADNLTLSSFLPENERSV